MHYRAVSSVVFIIRLCDSASSIELHIHCEYPSIVTRSLSPHLLSCMFTASSHLVYSRSLPVPSGQYRFTASPIWSVHVYCQSYLVSTMTFTASPIWTKQVHCQSYLVTTHSLLVPSGQYNDIYRQCHLVRTMVFTVSPIWSVR